MKIVIGGVKCKLTFQHKWNVEGYAQRTSVILEAPRSVKGFPPNKKLIGNAYCKSGDQFCKETGRRIALRRAIEKMPRYFRRQVWKQYFARSPKTAHFGATKKRETAMA